jgi:hypothetical protein
MQDYREVSKRRYYAQKEFEAKVKEEIEKEMKEFYEMLEKWDSIQPTSIDALEAIYSLFSIVLPIAKKIDLFFHIEKRVVSLVESLNDILKNQRLSIDKVRPFFNVMNCIITESGLDIPIEVMDTEKDEEFASRLLEEEVLLYEANVEENVEANVEENVEENVVENVEENVVENVVETEKPICSFTSRKGLTIPELKKIAKNHSLSLSGNKEDLCKRLAEHDLVRIIN